LFLVEFVVVGGLVRLDCQLPLGGAAPLDLRKRSGLLLHPSVSFIGKLITSSAGAIPHS
jgi:hypothetical protein